MPLGFERLNERKKRPNELVNFIKPLPGHDEAYAKDFLERIAAICYPIMKRNHIAVMSLEEYEFNREFIGRNFNAGEIIQLVLKGPHGAWMPFKHVQMVMMHELAHCKQMNHSKSFWKVRDGYTNELRELWNKKYTGEGLWGRGQTLLSGEYDTDEVPDAVRDIDRLCGGTYRTRGRKRKANRGRDSLSYAERKQRRILKKFGEGGLSLGGDEDARTKLESGKKVKGIPRVAGSARGRELRAAAALARFDQVKKEQVEVIKQEEESETDSESENETDDTGEIAIDTHGATMKDRKGRKLINVCGDEDPDDEDVKREMRELFDFGFTKGSQSTNQSRPRVNGTSSSQGELARNCKSPALTTIESPIRPPTFISVDSGDEVVEIQGPELGPKTKTPPDNPEKPVQAPFTRNVSHNSRPVSAQTPSALDDADFSDQAAVHGENASTEATKHPAPSQQAMNTPKTCSVCSLDNETIAVTCMACANVLATDRRSDKWSWSCQSLSCQDSGYRNANDYGRCGLCGAARP